MTNLRLPGQYDERLLSSLGLQGPYYNWNRWYLPGVGRYLELDPIALRGGFNGPTGYDWYGYSTANPLRHTDLTGMKNEPIMKMKDGTCCVGPSCVDCKPFKCTGRKTQTFNECMDKCMSYIGGPWWLQLGLTGLGVVPKCGPVSILQLGWSGSFALICADVCGCVDFP